MAPKLSDLFAASSENATEQPTPSEKPIGVIFVQRYEGHPPYDVLVHAALEGSRPPIVLFLEQWHQLSPEGEALIRWDDEGLAALPRHGYYTCVCRECEKGRAFERDRDW